MNRIGRRAHRQKAFSLVELIIAMAIGIFLLSGLLAVFFSVRQTSSLQGQLAQLQESERLAMTLIADVIQEAGYFNNTDPLHLTNSTTALPASGSFAAAGQAVVGASGVAAPGDSITVRFNTASGDGVINCQGSTNTTGAAQIYVNQFSVNNNNELVCALNGNAPVPLVSGVQDLQILYGVDTDGDGSADTYLDASVMTSANWISVISVKITVTFTNPLAGQPGQSNNPTIALTRVINVMSQS